MIEFTCRIMEMNVRIRCHYPYTEWLCRQYRITEEFQPDLEICCSAEEIQAEAATAEEHYEDWYLESLAIYRKISAAALLQGGFLLHAAVIRVENRGYGFLAPSGTGKSTHISLWKQYVDQPVTVINGDKPLVRMERAGAEVRFYAYGTPWCGKEGWNENTSVTLDGLCFLERGKQNRIRRLEREEYMQKLFSQIQPPERMEDIALLWSRVSRLADTVPGYLLQCDMSQNAVTCSYEALHFSQN